MNNGSKCLLQYDTIKFFPAHRTLDQNKIEPVNLNSIIILGWHMMMNDDIFNILSLLLLFQLTISMM